MVSGELPTPNLQLPRHSQRPTPNRAGTPSALWELEVGSALEVGSWELGVPRGLARFSNGPRGMTIPSSRHFPSSTDRAPVTSRETALDDTIESSFPASDPPSSIPDPEPEPAPSMSAEAIEERLTDLP